MRTFKTFVLLICVLFLSFPSNVIAAKLLPTMPDPVGNIQIIGDRLTRTTPNTCTFHYYVVDKNGSDITSQVQGSDINIDAFVSVNNEGIFGNCGKAGTSFDPGTGTCILTYNFAEAVDFVEVYLGIRYGGGSDSRRLYLGDIPKDTKVDEIKFTSDYLTKTGTNTATFQYKIINFIDDITKDIPSSQIDAVSSFDSSVTLDPSTGTGTIAFNSPDLDKIIKIALTDKLTGITAILNTSGLGKEPLKRTDASEISRINFVSRDLIKTGADTATFQYKLLDHYYTDVTKTIPASDIEATAVAGSSEAEISLDPLTGTGKVTYDFDTNKNAKVTLRHKTGVETSALLSIESSESENDKDNNNDDSEIARIVFLSTDMLKFNAHSVLQYQLLNKYGKDITGKIQASQIAVNSSVNSMIVLNPSEMTCKITYNQFDADRTIVVSLEDKLSGAKAALNIGNSPSETDTGSSTGDTIVTFKDSVLEQTIRTLINKPTADILERDVKTIPSLSVAQGCADLSGIENLTSLNSLAIHSDKIKDLSPLKEMVTLSNIVYDADSISDLKSLVELTNLKVLEIKNPKLNDEDLLSLKKALPNCYIYQ